MVSSTRVRTTASDLLAQAGQGGDGAAGDAGEIVEETGAFGHGWSPLWAAGKWRGFTRRG